MQVVMGGLTLNTTEETKQTVRVQEAILHENFRETPTAVYNDIGDPRLFYLCVRIERLRKSNFLERERPSVIK